MSPASTHPIGDLLRPGEGGLHRHLLVEQHAHQQREWVGVQQRVGCRLLDKLQIWHVLSVELSGRTS